MTELDRQIGQNLQRLRADRTSQAELARRMRDRGWKWTQPTVASVESGERPLKVAEAVDLAEVLERSYTDLISSHDVATVALERGRLAAVADSALQAAMADYEEARLMLAVALDAVPDDKLSGHLRAVGESWIDRPLESALASFRREQVAEDAKELSLAEQTAKEYESMMAHWRDADPRSWLARLNEVNSGEHQEEA